MYKENLKSNIHKLYRKDKYIDNILESAGTELDSVEDKKVEAGNEFSFDTMSLLGVGVWEKELDFKTTGELVDRQNQIEARWKTSGKCDLELLQNIADSWENGKVDIVFANGEINVIFISTIGVPSDVENLKKALEEAKPAHLGIVYIFTYRTWGMLKNMNKTWRYYKEQGYTWREIKDKVVL